MAENKINDVEKIVLLKRYILVADDFLHHKCIDKLNAFTKCPSYNADVVLELYFQKLKPRHLKNFAVILTKFCICCKSYLQKGRL